MRITTYYLLAFLLLLSPSLSAQESLTLSEALTKKLIKIAIQGTGCYTGECLEVQLQNQTSQHLTIKIEPGQRFASKDSFVQDLMVTAPMLVSISPRERTKRRLYTMCTQSRNAAPRRFDPFTVGPMAEENLVKMANLIAKNGYQNSTAQSAVWTIANNESTRYIYGRDTAMVKEIAKLVSEITGVPITEFSFAPREHHITSIRTSVEYLSPNYLENASLHLYDENGNQIRTYFEGRKVIRGFNQFRVGANHTLGDSAKLFLRLLEGDRMVFEKLVTVNDTIVPLKRVNSKAVMTYLMKNTEAVTVGIYDDEDVLYFPLVEDKTMREGFHRGTYIGQTHLPKGKAYHFKVRTANETLAEQAIDPNDTDVALFPKRTVKGVFSFSLKTRLKNAQIAVYDAEGRMKRPLQNLVFVNPGKKKYTYSFQHHEGPNAKFYIRLTDNLGRTWKQKEIIDASR